MQFYSVYLEFLGCKGLLLARLLRSMGNIILKKKTASSTKYAFSVKSWLPSMYMYNHDHEFKEISQPHFLGSRNKRAVKSIGSLFLSYCGCLCGYWLYFSNSLCGQTTLQDANSEALYLAYSLKNLALKDMCKFCCFALVEEVSGLSVWFETMKWALSLC